MRAHPAEVRRRLDGRTIAAYRGDVNSTFFFVVDEKMKEESGSSYPERPCWVKDVLKKGSGTEFVITAIEFDAVIPDYIFSKASLRK